MWLKWEVFKFKTIENHLYVVAWSKTFPVWKFSNSKPVNQDSEQKLSQNLQSGTRVKIKQFQKQIKFQVIQRSGRSKMQIQIKSRSNKKKKIYTALFSTDRWANSLEPIYMFWYLNWYLMPVMMDMGDNLKCSVMDINACI